MITFLEFGTEFPIHTVLQRTMHLILDHIRVNLDGHEGDAFVVKEKYCLSVDTRIY